MKILYVTPYVPSRIRTRPYSLIRALVDLGHQVTLLTFAGTLPEEQDQVKELGDLGIHTEIFAVSLSRSLANCLRSLPSREPLQAVYSYHPEMERRLGTLLEKDTSFDVVHIEHLRASRMVRTAKRVPSVYDSVECISLLFEQAARTSPQWRSRLMARMDLARTRRYEPWLLTQYDQVVITSQRDRDALAALVRRYLPGHARLAPVTVVTNGVDLAYFRPTGDDGQRAPRTVVFTGKMSYHANVAGALYFARQVLPRIWAQDPAVRFQIVGKDPPEAVRQLAVDERIQVTGYVDDLRPFLAQATVAICPVPYAAGVQFKVLEAMAMGTPVVCTGAAFEGLKARPKEDVLVADSADSFADHILRVCSTPTIAERLATAGRQYVEAYHSWEASARRLIEVYEQAIADRK